MRSATKPDVTAAACDVPVPRVNRSPTRLVGNAVSMNEPGSRRLTTCMPGATTSTLRNVPPLLNGATNPSRGSRLPLGSDAPTARIVGLYAGSVSRASLPSLPAAATTTMPCRHATSAAYDSGSAR